jgi:hypothetical protein
VFRGLASLRPDNATAGDRLSAHVDFLGVLFVVWGVLVALIGVSTLSLGVGSAALVASAGTRQGGQLIASLVAVLLVLVAVIAIALGSAHVAVGLPLRRHQSWARLAALMLGTVDLLLFPYGTVLGGYVLWVLLGEDRKKLFES